MKLVRLEPNIGAALKREREKAGITQRELADKVGTTPQNISQYERNIRSPKLETRRKLALALGVPADTFSIPAVADASDAFFKFGDTLSKMLSENGITASSLEKENNVHVFTSLETLILEFQMLNDVGQKKALERIHELTEIPRYTSIPANSEIPVIMPEQSEQF